MAEKYALQSEIPTKLSQLENDNKFLADSGGWQGPIPGEKGLVTYEENLY